MNQTARKMATYEDVLRAPPHMVAEIVDGELELSPRPSGLHGAAATALGIKLGSPYQFHEGGPGGWVFIVEPELHLVGQVMVPDLAGWRKERLPVVPEEPPYFTLAPDWVCEVLSPSTERLDRLRKLPAYARAGVTHTWLLNPRLRLLDALVLDGSTFRLLGTYGDEEPVRIPPFDAVELDLKRVWGEPAPK